MASSGMLRRMDLVRTDVSDEISASFIRVTRIDEIGTLAVTSNRTTAIRRGHHRTLMKIQQTGRLTVDRKELQLNFKSSSGLSVRNNGQLLGAGSSAWREMVWMRRGDSLGTTRTCVSY
jgi:hypothetical protein